MAVLPSQPQNRSSSPSQAGFLGRYRAATAADHSPWRRYPTCYGGVSGGTRWSSSSTSPFERSGSAITVTCREVVPADDDHLTAGRDDDDHDNWMCDDDSFGDEVGRAMSLEEVRNSSWLRGFLARMGELSPEEANDPVAAKLCPACKGDRGGSLTYPGLRALLDHARGAGPKRVWLHRWFAQILEEELRNRSVGGSPDASAKGNTVTVKRTVDGMVLWPPMVVVLNTRLGKREGSDKWVGMGNRDLMDCFKEYEPVKARSAYGSHGHCGASVLIFDKSVLGYHQAERLHNHFIQEGRGQYEWYKQKPWKQTTIKRLLYGYMATKVEELKMFSTNSGDKHKLKYDLMPYQLVVGNPLKEMHGSTQKLPSLETEIAGEIEQRRDLDGKLRQRDLEIEATRHKLNEESNKHNQEIESMNEYCEVLLSKLKESELAREKMQKQLCSSPQLEEIKTNPTMSNFSTIQRVLFHNIS